jgi:proton glutamate symport protein
MFKFTEYVMLFAPIGVFAAIAATVGENGIQVLKAYGMLVFALYFALIIFVVTVLLVVCRIIKIPFFNMVKVLEEPALIAFSTASSEAALPKAMEIMEDFGVPKKIVSFVMPTGYTFNLDGSTLYLSLATLFVAQLSGVHLSIGQQLMIMLTLMLTSKGIAGVPRVSLVILTGTLISFKIPVAGVAILLGIDQILDMGRTTVNLIGNCVASAVVARWENCFDDAKMNNFIAPEESIFDEIKSEFGNTSQSIISSLPLNTALNELQLNSKKEFNAEIFNEIPGKDNNSLF